MAICKEKINVRLGDNMSSFNGKFIEKLTSKAKIYLLVIILLSIILCVYDIRWLIPVSALVIGLVIYSIFDQNRKVSPLRKADDALLLDNGGMTKDEQDEWLLQRFNEIVSR